MLNMIKTLKGYCTATLTMFFKKNFFDDDKKHNLHEKFFLSNRNFTA